MPKIAALLMPFLAILIPGPPMDRQSEDVLPLLSTEHLIDVGHGRRLNFFCVGRGAPAVVFEQGTGGNILNWKKVAGPISRFTRTCFYDRAGYGFSDPATRPSSAVNITDDLHVAISKALGRTQVVLVGHSRGGLYATLYTDRFFDSVAGLVLVDPSFAGQDEPIPAADRAAARASMDAGNALMDTCAAKAEAGQLSADSKPNCFWFRADETPEERRFLMRQYIRPSRYRSQRSEVESHFPTDYQKSLDTVQEEAFRRDFGDLPLVVLTRAPPASGQPGEQIDYARWRAGHEQLARRSTVGKAAVATSSDHFIQLVSPDLVVRSVREVVMSARARLAKRDSGKSRSQ